MKAIHHRKIDDSRLTEMLEKIEYTKRIELIVAHENRIVIDKVTAIRLVRNTPEGWSLEAVRDVVLYIREAGLADMDRGYDSKEWSL